MNSTHNLNDGSACGDEAIHRYLDGDLGVTEQPALFEHLSQCPECRHTMDSVMSFRRMSRQEYIALPPAADEQFFARLAVVKQQADRVDRSSDRAPLWSARRSVSLRGALAMAACVFMFGLMLPMPERSTLSPPLIQMSAERVDFSTTDSMVIERQIYETHIYTYIDGPTVEGDREDEVPTEDI